MSATVAAMFVAVLPGTQAMAGAGTIAGTAVDKAALNAFEPTMCEPGKGKWTWLGKKSPWTVTHASAYENYSGATITRSKTAHRERTITASASTTVGAEMKAGLVIAKLDTQFSFTLGASGSHTKSTSETVTGTMKTGHVYVYYAGARKVSGQYTYSVCNSRGTGSVVKSRGTGTSYGMKREGAVRCGSKPAKNSLGYKAERAYC